MQLVLQKETYGKVDQATRGCAECQQNDQDTKVCKYLIPLGLRQDDGVGCFDTHQTGCFHNRLVLLES